ncbi:hypothetical protein DDR33_08535 [Pararcticibacter amylolyticus]|uniref:Uncharacterized protein n=1 Tax=Pararcticibacter amylolyticus TaxID=2173175 RepID=A0A2U2PHT7_9SPHI|nr:hypothetical protein DDR33_08535 [Pararcticibacter amylolyticus]
MLYKFTVTSLLFVNTFLSYYSNLFNNIPLFGKFSDVGGIKSGLSGTRECMRFGMVMLQDKD